MAGYKLIVSNLDALSNKYGAGLTDIQNAVSKLIAADKSAGITSAILYLDDATLMNAIGAPPVTDPQNDKQNKDAIDAAVKSMNKMMTLFQLGNGSIAHLLLLGSADIVPQQALTNPLCDADPAHIGSDLPYACDSPYSQDVTTFLSPTRAVGRLPDLTGSPDKSYFLDVITSAANRVAHSAFSFKNYFAVSSSDMESSTAQTLMSLFGGSTMEVCPPEGCSGIAACPLTQACPGQACPPQGTAWTAAQMAALTHYFNFHGISRSASGLGLGSTGGTIAMHAGAVQDLSAGMVAAHAGCYGAELYDPRYTLDATNHPGLCNTYLRSGCAAYFGSSTSAYGRPQSHNANSDLITQLFLHHLFRGSSSGLACLRARLDFIGTSQMTPKALKTVAQFGLMGDPSLAPVKSLRLPHPVVISPPGNLHLQPLAPHKPTHEAAPKVREWCDLLPHGSTISEEVMRKIDELAARHSGVEPRVKSFQVRRAEGFVPTPGKIRPTHIHAVCFNILVELAGASGVKIPRSVVYEIHEADGAILDVVE